LFTPHCPKRWSISDLDSDGRKKLQIGSIFVGQIKRKRFEKDIQMNVCQMKIRCSKCPKTDTV
jgi:hypothetical protein